MGSEWADRCPVCDAGFIEIGVIGRDKPWKVMCAGPVKHLFPVLEKRHEPLMNRTIRSSSICWRTEYRLGNQVELLTDV